MDKKDLAFGFAFGLGMGVVIGLLFAPESGEDARRQLREKTEGLAEVFDKLIFNVRWLLMSPRERYLYRWHRGGSLRDLRGERVSSEAD